jgi:hypothetical protein
MRLRNLLAVGWVSALAFAFLFAYDGWLIPVQFFQLAGAALPTLAFGPHFPAFMISRLADALCVAGICATAFPLGAAFAGKLTDRRDLFAGLFALALGFWCVAVVVLVIGAFSVRQVPWVFLGLAAWALPAPRSFLRRPRNGARLDGWSRLMLACVIVAGVLSLFGAMAPPFEYDELEYHLGALAEYQKAGRIVFLAHNFYSNLPQLAEMLYLLATVATSDIAAKLLHWLFGILSAAAVYAVGARLWSRRVAVSAAALFYCAPFVQDLSQTARIDLATTFFAVLAFGALLSSEWRLGAIAAGCAVATKWTAVPVVLLPCLVVFVKAPRRIALFILLSSLFILPWLVKNWLLAGNPVYPLLDWVFSSPHWSAEQATLFARRHYPTFSLSTPVEFFERTWHYSFAEPMAVPLLLATAPLVLLLRPADRNAKRAGWLFVAAYAGWFLLTFRPWRFLLPAFPLAALLGAYAIWEAGKLARAIVGVVLAIGLMRMASVTLVDAEDYKQTPPQMSFLHFGLCQTSRDEFIARMDGGMYEPILWMNENLPASAKVLYVGEARVYYARHDAVWATAFDQSPVIKLWGRLREQGITHVYVNHYEWQRLRRGYDYLAGLDPTAWSDFIRQHAEPIHVAGPCVVYALKD